MLLILFHWKQVGEAKVKRNDPILEEILAVICSFSNHDEITKSANSELLVLVLSGF